ncbi:glycoside hydrolase family 15 protein [Streptomyces nodosus]|uniref:glycoside hydrolase family 15 protein n=1 Tax=Streptomyces nodosus TaxID=40318 RepID=UPI001A947C75|nr:glycoside hydrolase family 15 protein [Streptomyces nodosus]
MAGRIEDYALIGDLETAALIGRDGTIDWLCLPRLDSQAVFAALLGTEDNGSWSIGPADSSGQSPTADRRAYRGDSLLLESEWDTPTGTLRVTDFMPPRGGGAPRLIRIVEAVRGTVTAVSTLRLRFDYGKVVPWVQRTDDDRVRAVAGPHAVWLDTEAETHGEALTTRSCVTLAEGERMAFALSWHPSYAGPPDSLDTDQALQMQEDTAKFWADWASHCAYNGPYRDAVIRSLITLKALTNPLTGGIVAAATTSLPEDIGGVRNWDYRYVWLRDAAITMSCLLRAGYRDEARAWRDWLLRAVAGDPENLQIMYGIAGEREMPETTLSWLTGYENSTPVRIGNGAANQRQLDVYGEVIEALLLAAHLGLERDEPSNTLLIELVQFVEANWREPDKGIWESRGPDRHFVHSKVMAWVAVDCAIKLIEGGHAEGPLDHWRLLRDTIHQDVCENGYDPDRNTFTQFYGSWELDAALLLIPQVGFLPADDERVIGTVEAIQRELSTPDGFLRRYPTEGDNVGNDGLAGDEGAFLVCAFWLADDLAMIGRVDEARDLFERLLALRNDVGLLAEEWDSHQQRQVGNYPQAYSHIGIVDAALSLENPIQRRPLAIVSTPR